MVPRYRRPRSDAEGPVHPRGTAGAPTPPDSYVTLRRFARGERELQNAGGAFGVEKRCLASLDAREKVPQLREVHLVAIVGRRLEEHLLGTPGRPCDSNTLGGLAFAGPAKRRIDAHDFASAQLVRAHVVEMDLALGAALERERDERVVLAVDLELAEVAAPRRGDGEVSTQPAEI